MQYGSATQSLPAFARALQLDVVVEGSVLLEGDCVTISLRVIDALNDRHVWAHRYEGHPRDVLSWQSDAARSIVQRIDVTLTPTEDARLNEAHPVDYESHAAYLRGLYYWHQSFTETAFKSAIAHFRHAIELDPGHASAWSSVANCFSAMAVQSILPPAESASEAKHAAERAVALDPSSAQAQLSMAAIQLFFEWNWALAERGLKTALDLSPSYSLAHSLFTHYAVARGWAEHAIRSARRALDLDPMSPVANVDLAWAYLLTRDYRKARDQCSNILDMRIDFPLARLYLGQVYQCMGNHKAAIEEMEKVLPSHGDAPAPMLAMLGQTYGLAGRNRAAREAMRRLEELASRCYVSPYDRAVLQTGLGEKQEALRWLRQALAERSPRMIWLNVEPAFDTLRGDRHFQNIIRDLGLDDRLVRPNLRSMFSSESRST